MSNDILTHLADRVLLCDGGFGSLVQAMPLTVEGDFDNCENCTEVLNRTRPDVVREIHGRYFAAGADMVESNTFGGSPITLAEFGLENEAFDLNRRAVEIAHEAAEAFSADGRRRFVLGGIGPGTKLPSLGHIDYNSLEAAFQVQASGLIAGRADAILIETCQDPLQVKAALNGSKLARLEAGVELPIFVQVTVETTGTLLVGSDIAAAATVIESLGADGLGLNCATGPAEMAEHVRWLGANWPRLISIQPNAGLPELRDGKPFYPLTPQELASTSSARAAAPPLSIPRRWTPCCGGSGTINARHRRSARCIGCRGWPRCIPASISSRRTPFSPSANAATPMVQRNSACCKTLKIGMAPSLLVVSR